MNEKVISFVTDIRVRYAETDGMRVVYHGNYLTYFEHARTELLRSLGLPYNEIEKLGIFIVVIEAHAEYKRSAQYDDILHVKASINEMPSLKIRITYEITRNNETEIVVTGHTVHTFLNAQTNRPTRPPREFISVMEQHFKDL
ncbi:MAG: thioesterase family protein [Bacteroidota bacterium]|jgi:acyl-CoA thioester hydrolase